MIANEGGLRTVAQSTGKEFTTVELLFWKVLVHHLNHQQWPLISFLYTQCSQLNQSWRSSHAIESPPRKPFGYKTLIVKKKWYEPIAWRYMASLDALIVNGFHRIQAERTPND